MGQGQVISIDEVLYNKNGRPYIERWVPSSQRLQRHYGEIRKCIWCGKDFFYLQYKKGEGQHCSQKCIMAHRSKEAFDGIIPVPYQGKMTWQYVAGFFDGEGSLVWHPGGKSFQVKLTQYEPSVLREIQKFLLSYRIKSGLGTRGTESPKDLFISNIYCIKEFIEYVADYCIVKEELLMETLFRIEDILCVD